MIDTILPALPYRFAYQLFKEGEYDYSIIELKRLQSTSENTEDKNYAQTLMAVDHFANKSVKKARAEIDRVDLATLSPERRSNSFIVDYLIADAEELDAWNAARCREALAQGKISQQELLLKFQIFSLVKAGEYDSAKSKRLPATFTDNYITDVEESGSKSAALAGIMSAVLPGSGYVYTGRWKEGISALTFNALLGWGIYSLFKNHNTGSGILLSSFAAPFYIGNIVGASNAALAENAKDKELALGKLRNHLELDFYFSMDFLKECWK
jgi:hypothetical protein